MSRSASPPLPLRDVRVLEVCSGIAGAFCARLLADLGANVLKIEPPEGDPIRRQDAAAGNGGLFRFLNAGKHSVTAAPISDGVRRMVSDADIVVDDSGLVSEPPRAARESLIVCAITPFGRTGRYAKYRGTHLTQFHAGGEGSLLPSGAGWSQFPDRAPIQIGSNAGEYDTGYNAAIAVLAAYRARLRTGHGDFIDVSMQESFLTLNRTRLSRYTNDGIRLQRAPSPYPIGGMLACLDGYVQLVGIRDEVWVQLALHPQGRAFDRTPLDTREGRESHLEVLRDALATWCQDRPSAEVVQFFSAAGCPVGAFATAADVIGSAQLAHRHFFQSVGGPDGTTRSVPGVPYVFSETPIRLGDAPALGSSAGFALRSDPGPTEVGHHVVADAGDLPLSGIRIVDFTWAAAGPYATLLLALLGAEVIKIESADRADPARRGFLQDYGGPELSPNFNELNLNKRSCCVDLKDPEGLEFVRQLIALSDVVVDNFRPGVMRRLGLGEDTLRGAHPRLIVASSSANGSTGPDAHGAGLASIFGATSGLSEQTGYPDGPPTEIGESTDYRSGNALAYAILAAVLHRQRGGSGQFIDLSSREVAAAIAPDALLAESSGASRPPRIANRHRYAAPHGVFPTSDAGWIAISIMDDAEWTALTSLLERPELAADFPRAVDRLAHESTLEDLLTEWTSTRRATELFELLQTHGIAAAPVCSNADLAMDPHLIDRGVFVDVRHPVIGVCRVMRAPWLFARAQPSVQRPGPLLGADNRFVGEAILGHQPAAARS